MDMKNTMNVRSQTPLVTDKPKAPNNEQWHVKRYGQRIAMLLLLIMFVALFYGNETLASDERTNATIEMNHWRQFLRSDVDKVENIKWIHSKKTPVYVQSENIYTYLGEQRGVTWARVFFGFKRSLGSLVNMSAIIINIDGTMYTLPVKYLETKTRAIDGGLLESIDMQATPELEEILRMIAHGNEVIVRGKGRQFQHDFTVSQDQKEALKHIWGYYRAKRALGETLE